MGDNIEQWRARIGQWSGGRPRQCVTLQHCIAQTSNHACYRLIRFLVLVSLLIIGCVELNPGPNQEAPLPNFDRRSGTSGQHGMKYEEGMAAFLYARALNETGSFHLSSNVKGTGAFDDLVFRYRLKESDNWKTCFIQLKHKENKEKNNFSGLTNTSGDFSLLKYFSSYCRLKKSVSKNEYLQACGSFDDFEFILYTNCKMERNSAVKRGVAYSVRRNSAIKRGVAYSVRRNSAVERGVADLAKILSSRKKKGGDSVTEYVTFDGNSREHIAFLEELPKLAEYRSQLIRLATEEQAAEEKIKKKAKELKNSFKAWKLRKRFGSLISNPKGERKMLKDCKDCIPALSTNFLKKLTIFQQQSCEEDLEELIKEELQKVCEASISLVNSAYEKFKEGLEQWRTKREDVKWLTEKSSVWRDVEEHLIKKIKQKSEYEIQKIERCVIGFNQQHIERFSIKIEQNTVWNIVTNTNDTILSKKKIHQALKFLHYKNPLFINFSFFLSGLELGELWPCRWSDVTVIDCDCDDNVADHLINNLLKSLDHEKAPNNSDKVETWVETLKKQKKKLILISPSEKNWASRLPDNLRDNFKDCEDNFNMLDLDKNSQKQILERTVNFQGISDTLRTLVGADPPEEIKSLIKSDVISNLLSGKRELFVGNKLVDTPMYHALRVLQRHIYLKEDILKMTDNKITFAVSGLKVDGLKEYLTAGEKICEFVCDEEERNYSFKIDYDFPITGRRTELGTVNTHQTVRKSKKPDDIRYVTLGDLKLESAFSELKALCTNVHWIHMENGSFLWRDSNCNIDIIHRYIDERKCKSYEMGEIMEQSDRIMLLVAEPGMGKSTFLSCMAREIKKRDRSVWVLRINLNEHTPALDNPKFTGEGLDKCKEFLLSAACSPEQKAVPLVEKIFLNSLTEGGKVIVILDGFDEISACYGDKVERLISTIIENTSLKIWVSSRFCHQQYLEKIAKKLAFTLKPFTPENQIEFFVQYWKKFIQIPEKGRLRLFANMLCSLCSTTLGDKNREFTGIPLQTKMLGKAFVKEATEYCSNGKVNLLGSFNLLHMFKTFTEKKCDIYICDKTKMNISQPEAKRMKESCLEGHELPALMYLFSQVEVDRILGEGSHSALAQKFMQDRDVEKYGIITEIRSGIPHFIHRWYAEYFAAKWFAGNFTKCEDLISNTLFKPTYKVTRNIFDRILSEKLEIHGAVLSNDVSAVEEILKNATNINITDEGGRTALHLAASYNSSLIKKLLSFPGVDVNKRDAVLKWTPLQYAERMKSRLAVGILLQNGANRDDIELTRRNSEAQE